MKAWVVTYHDGDCRCIAGVFTTKQAANEYVWSKSKALAAGYPDNYPAPYRKASYWAVLYDIESAEVNPR